MKNAINWFEIPVSDFDRAQTFYETVLDGKTQVMEAMGMKMAMFPAEMESGGIGGGIVLAEGYVPTPNGTLVYLNGGEDLGVPLARVEAAGGKIVLPKTAIGSNGFMAHFLDTEGNKVAFHSMK
jgi:uncharacterized protein